MNENGLNYIDLFAGAGGLSEGFIQSGYRPVAHVEMNEHAAKTIETRIAYYYLKDNGKIKSYYDYEKGKITREQLLEKIPKEELKTVINKEMSESTIKGIFNTIDDIKREKEIDKIDVIIGGPPCQAYSLVGRAQSSHMIVPMEDDPRNELYKMYVQFLRKYKPRMFVFENVAGIKTARGGAAFKNLQTYMKRVGYEIDYHELNAQDFGVLQSRKRVIIVGWLKGTGYEYPSFDVIHSKAEVWDLLNDLPVLKPGEEAIEHTMTDMRRLKKYVKDNDIRVKSDVLTGHIARPHTAQDIEIYVLDSFLGSGTTAATAHKMGRKWIGIEMGEHAYSHCQKRLCNVIDGEQTGISKSVNWHGGGGFKFYELAEPLLVKNKVLPVYQINPSYTWDMVCEAICKIEGFTYEPSGEFQGHSSENRFIHITEEFVNTKYVMSIMKNLGDKQSLLIYCKKNQADMILPENVEVKKIPKDLLDKCNFESEVQE